MLVKIFYVKKQDIDRNARTNPFCILYILFLDEGGRDLKLPIFKLAGGKPVYTITTQRGYVLFRNTFFDASKRYK